MDLLIAGAGLSGLTLARQFADNGKKVLIVEKRENIAGNCFDYNNDGIMVQKYGPHIFHTNDEHIMNFLNRFTTLNNYKNRVKVHIKEHIVPLPFNFTGIDKIWPDESKELKLNLKKEFKNQSRVTILDLLNSKQSQFQKVTNFIYENIFANYTSKMWGIPVEQIDKYVLKRVPINLSYEDTYFNDKYEGIPQEGFTTFCKKLAAHENIKIILGTDVKEKLKLLNKKIFYKNKEINCPVVFTTPIDEFFDYKFKSLDYRSLHIKFEKHNIDQFQIGPIHNYPSHRTMTRITEYKQLYDLKIDSFTIISKEYPGKFSLDSTSKFSERFYPMPNKHSKNLYDKYAQLINSYSNLYALGRLAEYKYKNMDVAIKDALALSKKLLNKENK